MKASGSYKSDNFDINVTGSYNYQSGPSIEAAISTVIIDGLRLTGEVALDDEFRPAGQIKLVFKSD